MTFYNAFYIENPTFGIKELVPGSFNLFPNPTTGKVKIENHGIWENDSELIILGITGQIVEKRKLNAANSFMDIDLSGNPKGVYLVKMITRKGTDTLKLILQ